MATMPSLQMLSREWENTEEIRDRVRKDGVLLWKEAWEDKLKIDIHHTAKNYSVLRPLCQRLQDSNGAVGMHTVPKIQHQFLGNFSGWYLQFCSMGLGFAVVSLPKGLRVPFIFLFLPESCFSQIKDQDALHDHEHPVSPKEGSKAGSQRCQEVSCADQAEASEGADLQVFPIQEAHGSGLWPRRTWGQAFIKNRSK